MKTETIHKDATAFKTGTAVELNAEISTNNSVHAGFRLIQVAADMLVWLVLAIVAVVLLDHLLPTMGHFMINALAYSAMAGLFLGYYFTLEYFFQRTLGKLLTGTKVVDRNGGKPTGKVILVRTLARLIPVDFLSYLFVKNGIHDVLSRTKVVKIKKK